MGERRVSKPTVSRLPLYWRSLERRASDDLRYVSSEQLANWTGFKEPTIRRDLWSLGVAGVRGFGYDVATVVLALGRHLGLERQTNVVIVGVGHLGHALAQYPVFATHGMRVAALLDADPDLAGYQIGDAVVEDVDCLEQVVAARDITVGIIAVPADAAQDVAERLAVAGIGGILNFAPRVLVVPDTVMVRNVDLSVELQILAYYLQAAAGPVNPQA